MAICCKNGPFLKNKCDFFVALEGHQYKPLTTHVPSDWIKLRANTCACLHGLVFFFFCLAPRAAWLDHVFHNHRYLLKRDVSKFTSLFRLFN